MITFILGLLILILGAAVYGRICEKVMNPTDRKTKAAPNSRGWTMSR